MRVDSFLSAVGIVKRRSEAARLLREGRVHLDDRAVKPAAEARAGALLKIDGPRGVTRWRILAIPSGNVRKSDYARYAERLDEETSGTR